MKNILLITHSTQPDLGKINTIFTQLGATLQPCCLPCGDTLPANLNGIDGLMLMGSAHGVYDAQSLPWMQKEIAWMEEIGLQSGLPTLGICFGAQLLAYMYGGSVEKGQKGTSFGYYPLKVLAEDPLFGTGLNTTPVFDSHNDVFTLPQGATHLASNAFYPHQAAKFAEGVYGLQFHPEVTTEVIEKWYAARKAANMLPNQPQNLEETLAEFYKDEAKIEAWFTNFLKNLFTL